MSALSSAGSRIVLMGTQQCANDRDAPPVPSVKSTMDDLADVMVNRCGADPDNIIRVLDAADPMRMGVAVAEAAEQATDVLLVHYVGHGFPGPDGELYLATRATDPSQNRLQHNSLRWDTVRKSLLNSRARTLVVILDCCFSGRAAERTLNSAEPVDLADVHGGYILTAGAREQLALAPKGQRHTAFTGELIRLLRDGDPESPAELRMRHVYRALNRRLRARSLPPPFQRNIDQAEDLVLAANNAEDTGPSTGAQWIASPRKRRRPLATLAVTAVALVVVAFIVAPAPWRESAPAPPPPTTPQQPEDPPVGTCKDRNETGPDRCGDVPAGPTAINADGHLVTLVRNLDGSASRYEQTSSADPAGKGTNIGGNLAGDPVVVPDARGVLGAFAIGSEGFLKYDPNTQSNSNTWHPITPLLDSPPFTGKPAVAQDDAGKLTVFARDVSGKLWRIKQNKPGLDDWTVPELMEKSAVKDDPMIQKDKNNALRVFALGKDNKEWGWAQHPERSPDDYVRNQIGDEDFKTSPSVTLDVDGKAHLFALGIDGSLQHNIEGEDAATWPNGWHEIGQPGPYDGQPVAGKDGENKVAVFVRRSNQIFKVNQSLKVTPIGTPMERILSVAFKPDEKVLVAQGFHNETVVSTRVANEPFPLG